MPSAISHERNLQPAVCTMKDKPNSTPPANALSATLDNGNDGDNRESAGVSSVRARSEDSSEARSRQILKAFVAFRDGDFSARLPADWPGIDGRIAETFNQTIVREESMTRRSATAKRDGREGRPPQAANVVAGSGRRLGGEGRLDQQPDRRPGAADGRCRPDDRCGGQGRP